MAGEAYRCDRLHTISSRGGNLVVGGPAVARGLPKMARPFLIRTVAAATGVDAAAGLVAGCAANQLGAGHQAAAVFALGASACIACHLVLLPGLVWAVGPVRMADLLRRTGMTALALALAVMAGLCCGMALAALPNPFGPGAGWAATARLWSGRVLLAMILAGAGALVGLGAAAADTLDRRRPGGQPSPSQFRAHVRGGAIAVLPILLLAWAAEADALGSDLMVRQTWPDLPLLAVPALVLAGGPHTLLVLLGARPASLPKPALWRTATIVLACCCAAVGLVAGTPTAATRPLHVSPGGRYAVLLVSDTTFGQIEELRVIADPGTPAARVIFEQMGDQPLRVKRWTDAETAELAYAAQGEDAPADLTLKCQDQTCELN